MKRPLSAALFALGALAAVATSASASSIERTGPDNFPISSVVVIKSVGGVDFAYASGTPGAASAGNTEAQTVDALTKLLAGLKAQGFGAGDIVMLRVFLVGDPALGGKMDFMGMMAGYKKFFGTPEQPNKPARTTVEIAGLASPGSLVEIEAQAVRKIP